MSSGKLENAFHEIIENSHENISEREIDVSQLVIPFSKVFRSYKPRDIYSEAEKIPFKKRDTEFKMIFRQEFSGFLR